MNKSILLATVVLSIAAGSFGQVPPPPPRALPGSGMLNLVAAQADAPSLTKFSLDFHGGHPKELVTAIEKAIGKPINVIIQDDDAGADMPPLKMTSVTLPGLFKALGESSSKSVAFITSTYYGGGTLGSPSHSYQSMLAGYSFLTTGTPTDDSVWYFKVEKPSFPPLNQVSTCRYYSLAKYIAAGFSVEDITTAIQTGWKMMGESSTPDLRFHKETKLLIAVGAPGKIETIDTVLKALEPPAPPQVSPAAKPAAGPSKPAAPVEPDQE